MQVCNLNCICTNADCLYKHFIDYKERKNVKRFYIKLNIKKPEEDYGSRNANCTYGQLCNKPCCGYRHRISFEDREKLITAYKYYKICPEKEEKPKLIEYKKPEIINNSNAFSALQIEEVEEIDEIKEVQEVKEIEEVQEKDETNRKWVNAVINSKKKINMKFNSSNWGDICEDDYLMKF